MLQRGLIGALCVSALLLAACGGDDWDAAFPCDPIDLACRRMLTREVGALRGGRAIRQPMSEIIDRQEFRRRLQESVDAQTPEEALAVERWARALVLLRLVSSDDALTSVALDELVDGVLAYYDRETRRITMIDQGTPPDPVQASLVFAHELVHFAQDDDQMRGFAAFDGLETSLDAFEALRHHSEGEAVFLSNLLVADLTGFEISPAEWNAYFQDGLNRLRRDIADSADPYLITRNQAKYIVGTQFLYSAYVDGGRAEVLAQWDAAIDTTASWMRGRGREALAEDMDVCAFPITPAAYELYEDDRLGGEMLYAMLSRDQSGATDAALTADWDMASGWRGDRLRAYVAPADGAVAVAYRVRFADADAAQDVALRLAAQQPADADAVVLVEAQDVLLLRAEDPSVWLGWQYDPDCEPGEAAPPGPGGVDPFAAFAGLPDTAPLRGAPAQL